MGWWWSSDQEAESHSTPIPKQNETDPTLNLPQTPPSPPTKIAEPPRALTRDEQADAELESFLREIQSEAQSPSSPATATSNTTTSSSPSPSPTDISPTSLFPTTISCRAAFDSAYYCQSLGGQFTNLYRYGTVRSCSDQWSNFWFCMRTNRGMMSDELRMKTVQDHYRQRAVKYKVGPSSEDIWAVRLERLEGAFEGDLEGLEREEEERRKRVESGG